MALEFYVITDIIPDRPELSSNGGDYYFGRTVAVKNGLPVAVRFWTSAEFDYCTHSGHFGDCDRCGDDERASEKDFDGWLGGDRIIDPSHYNTSLNRYNNGDFAYIR